MEIFFELAAVLVVTTVVSFVMRWLRQPLVVGYILSGIIAGPAVLNILHETEALELFSKLGITLLLFIVGLNLNPRVIKEVGRVSLATGVGQVLFTSAIGFGIALLLGLNAIAALYMSIGLTFSSTIIILKLLSDKGELQTLYGKIAIGMLLVQDLVATIILIVVSSLSQAVDLSFSELILGILVKGLLLVLVLTVCIRWIIPAVIRFASRSTELLFVFTLTWGLGLASIFQYLGFSVEIGALVAGVVLSATAVAEEVGSRMRPLRDFFIILFFILLGSSLILNFSAQILIPVGVFSLFVLLGNPIIVVVILNLLGYHKKVGFFTGLTVAQISEFSLILATLGFQIGHLSQDTLTIITLVGLVTISVSTYLILYGQKIYPVVEHLLQYLELRKAGTKRQSTMARYDVLLFGFNRSGHEFLQLAEELGYSVAVVDYDPETAERLTSKKIPVMYGDASNAEFLESLPIRKSKLVITTLPALEANLLVTKHIATLSNPPVVISFAQHKTDALSLYEAGASYVVLPQHVGARHVLDLVKRVGFNLESFLRKRDVHLRELSQRIA